MGRVDICLCGRRSPGLEILEHPEQLGLRSTVYGVSWLYEEECLHFQV